MIYGAVCSFDHVEAHKGALAEYPRTHCSRTSLQRQQQLEFKLLPLPLISFWPTHINSCNQIIFHYRLQIPERRSFYTLQLAAHTGRLIHWVVALFMSNLTHHTHWACKEWLSVCLCVFVQWLMDWVTQLDQKYKLTTSSLDYIWKISNHAGVFAWLKDVLCGIG